MRLVHRLRFAIQAGAVAVLAAAAAADPGGTAITPLEDRIQWVTLPHELIAVDAASRGERRAALGVGEQVLRTWADGQVGVALTDRRLLAVTSNTGGVHEVRFLRSERVVSGPMLGDRVALAVTSRRALGFDGGSGNWVEASLGPHERVVATAVANHVAALATDRRALALSPARGGFFSLSLGVHDAVLALEATGDLATLRTRTRLLVYRGTSDRWAERSIGLGN